MTDDKEATIERAYALVEQIKPLLAGAGPDAQGAALADLVSMWVAGHNPAIREATVQMWIEIMKALVPVSEYEMFGDAGFPEQMQ